MDNSLSYYSQITAYLNGELSSEDIRAFEVAMETDKGLAEEIAFQKQLRKAVALEKKKKEAKEIINQLKIKKPFNQVKQLAVEARILLESAKGNPEKIKQLVAQHAVLARWKAVDEETFNKIANINKAPAKIRTLKWINKVAGIAASIAILIFVWSWNQKDTALVGLNLEETAGFTPTANSFIEGKTAFLKKDYPVASDEFKRTLGVLRLPIDSLKVHYALAITYLRTEKLANLKLETAAMIDIAKNLKTEPDSKETQRYIDWAEALQKKIRNEANWQQHLELDF